MEFKFNSKETMRLDKYLSGVMPEVSRSHIQQMIKGGKVLVNNEKVKTGFNLSVGDKIYMKKVDPVETIVGDDALNVEIIYEDKDIIVINKPEGMIVHPTSDSNRSGTVVNALFDKIEKGFGDPLRPGIVHRLDKDTSGLMVVAKNKAAYEALVSMFKKRGVEKHYIALVRGVLDYKEGIIDSPIMRDFRSRKKMGVASDKVGKNAITLYKVIKEIEIEPKSYLSLLDVEIKTGRTHQIRVHMSAIGHPVVGDKAYGFSGLNKKMKEVYGLNRQFLHACRLSFPHPITRKKLNFEIQLPNDLAKILK
jgi:23S rRNA pseudouridine1911/1915/1917 synthase